MFRNAAEASKLDILKLYNVNRTMLTISPNLPANTPQTRYRLDVIAAHYSRMLNSYIARIYSYLCDINSGVGSLLGLLCVRLVRLNVSFVRF